MLVLTTWILLSCPALASSPSPESENRTALADPSDPPSEGHLISDSSIGYKNFSETLKGSYKYGERVSAWTESLLYGASNDIVISIVDGYSQINEKYDYYNSLSQRFSSSGFQDPSVGIIYRALHQGAIAELPLNIDLSFTYSPNLMRAYDLPATSPGGRGDPAPGGSTTDVSLTVISKLSEDVAVLGRIGVTLYGKQRQEDPDAMSSVTYSAHNPYYFDAGLQYRPHDRYFFVRIGSRFIINQPYKEYIAVHGSAQYSYDNIDYTGSGATLSPFAVASYTLIPNLISVSIKFEHSIVGNSWENSRTPGLNYRSPMVDASTDSISLGIRVVLH